MLSTKNLQTVDFYLSTTDWQPLTCIACLHWHPNTCKCFPTRSRVPLECFGGVWGRIVVSRARGVYGWEHRQNQVLFMSMCGHHMTPKHHQTTLAPSNTLYMHATTCLDAWLGVCVSMVACWQVETGHMSKGGLCDQVKKKNFSLTTIFAWNFWPL